MNIRFDWQIVAQPDQYIFLYDVDDQSIKPKWIASDLSDKPAGYSLCAGTLNLELGVDWTIVLGWGYFPRTNWDVNAREFLPNSHPGRVRVIPDGPLVPGVSVRIPGLWRPRVARTPGWFQMEAGTAANEQAEIFVRVAEGLICGLAKSDLVSIWLFVGNSDGLNSGS